MKQKGFTLVELIVVIVIMVVLAIIAVPVYKKSCINKAKITQNKALLSKPAVKKILK
jgi:prepilin-type N-terminal cleavage/methylation domain-containing protein